MHKPAVLVLEDGSIFQGVSIGVDGITVGEVVFNTAITGYQEILSDPSYTQQIVTLTYPHIGNVGMNLEDMESSQIWAAGLVIRDLPLLYSNWRAETSLAAYLQKYKKLAIAEIDTRRLTRILQEKGSLRGAILAGTLDSEEAFKAIHRFSGLVGLDLAQEVTTKKEYHWSQGTWGTKTLEKNFNVIVYDLGVKQNILRYLVDKGCQLTVVPAKTPIGEVLKRQPDGVVFSNGPGDPQACHYAIEAIKVCLDKEVPTLGICLGHQLLGLACQAKTVKMKFGHHGANHPVIDLETEQVMITSQNHGFAVDEKTLPDTLMPTHRSLFDGSLQGIRHLSKPALGFQGHPEASPGPHDVDIIFNRFIALMSAVNCKV
jgi:carbamoyl-phosphate synthase small subunit